MRMTPRDRADPGRDDDQEDTETVSAEELASLKAEAAAVARLADAQLALAGHRVRRREPS